VKIEFTELRSHSNLRLGARFADWERPAVNGNSIGIFFWVFSETGKPDPQEIFLRYDAQCIGRLSTLSDSQQTLKSLCPGREKSAVFGHLCINRLILRSHGRIAVLVSDEAGYRHHLGTITFDGNLASKGLLNLDLGLRPILISSLGRSGSTVLTNSLGLHPEIALFGGYPFEYRFFSYCLHATYILSSPANHDFSMGGGAFETSNTFNIGFNPFNHRDYDRQLGNSRLRKYYEGDFTRKTAQFFVGRAKEGIALAALRKKRAVAFVEKMGGAHLANLADNICANVREIVLVRGFWDMATSMIAFDAKRALKAFNSGNPDDWLIAMAFQHLHLLRRSRLSGKIVVSYEDLTRDPQQRLETLARELGIARDTGSINAMMKPFREKSYLTGHSTGSSKDEARGVFSVAAIHAVESFLELSNGEEAETSAGSWATWPGEGDNLRRTRSGSRAPSKRLVLPAAWPEAWGLAVQQAIAGYAERATRSNECISTLEAELDTQRNTLIVERTNSVSEKANWTRLFSELTNRAERSEAYALSLQAETARMATNYEQERQAWLSSYAEAERQCRVLSDRANVAEVYNQALLAEQARLQSRSDEIGAARDKERKEGEQYLLTVVARAERAEEYAGTLADELRRVQEAVFVERAAFSKEMESAREQIAAMGDRAHRAESHNLA
jgi:hypothetical protein